ncbi:MAG: hypothetical protein ACE5I4_07680 [Thermoplasmata archaeon]
MVVKNIDKPIATTHVGAYPKPKWFSQYQLSGRDMLDVFKDQTYEQAYRDAVAAVIKDQELAGVDIVADGKMAYDEFRGGTGWFQYTLDRVNGITGRSEEITSIFAGHPLEVIQEMASAYGSPVATEKLSAGPMRLALEYKISKELTDKPIKFNIGDSSIIATMILNGGPYEQQTDLIMDLAKIYNKALRELDEAGAPFIQTDTSPINVLPSFREVSDDEFAFFVDAFNTMFDGVKAEKWIHVCWGRLHGQPLLGAGAERAWDIAYPHLIETNADTVNMHMSYAGDDVLKVMGEYDTDKNIALGAVSISSLLVESPEKIADLLTNATKYVDPNKLYATTDCGLITIMDRTVAQFKLKSLVEGANLARKEVT